MPSGRIGIKPLAAIAVVFALTLCVGSSALGSNSSSTRLLVKFRVGTSSNAAARALAALGAKQVRVVRDLNVRVAGVPSVSAQRTLQALNANPHVKYAERDLIRRPTDTMPNDPLFPIGATWGGEWGSFLTQAPKAWSVTTGSSQVIIADIDSGVAGAHPDFAGQLVSGYNVLTGT